jgi:hypothetical protein
VLIQGGFKGAPPFVITQASQYAFESIIREINVRNRLTSRGPKHPKPLGYPGFNMHHPVVTPR